MPIDNDGKIPFKLKKKDKEPLTYEELRLGNKTKEAFRQNPQQPDLIEGMPLFTNSRNWFGNLDTTDAVIGGVLSASNVCLLGDSGCGKSQVAEDISNNYFNGKVSQGGNASIIQGSNDLNSMEMKTQLFTILKNLTDALTMFKTSFIHC